MRIFRNDKPFVEIEDIIKKHTIIEISGNPIIIVSQNDNVIEIMPVTESHRGYSIKNILSVYRETLDILEPKVCKSL